MPGQEVEQLNLAQDLMQHLALLRPFPPGNEELNSYLNPSFFCFSIYNSAARRTRRENTCIWWLSSPCDLSGRLRGSDVSGEARMGVNLLSQPLSPLLATTRCQLSSPGRLSPVPPPLTNDSGILRSGTVTSWGNLYSDQNTWQKAPIKSHKTVKQRNLGLRCRGEGGQITIKM